VADWANKTHREQDKINFHRKFSAGNRLELWRWGYSHGVQLLHMTGVSAG
jgi:hypothetical protein